MTPKLSPEQQQALHEQTEQPVVVIDESTQIRYVLVPADAYERVQALLGESPFDIRETYPAQNAAAAAAGWDDPALDAYNDYDSHRRTT